MEYSQQPQYGIWFQTRGRNRWRFVACVDFIPHTTLSVDYTCSWLVVTHWPETQTSLAWSSGELHFYLELSCSAEDMNIFMPCSTIWAQLSRLHHISSCIDLEVVCHDVIVALVLFTLCTVLQFWSGGRVWLKWKLLEKVKKYSPQVDRAPTGRYAWCKMEEWRVGGGGRGEQEGWSLMEARVEGGMIALQLYF